MAVNAAAGTQGLVPLAPYANAQAKWTESATTKGETGAAEQVQVEGKNRRNSAAFQGCP